VVGMDCLEGENICNNHDSSIEVSKNFRGMLVTQGFKFFLLLF
jgi:hypothetical protein